MGFAVTLKIAHKINNVCCK